MNSLYSASLDATTGWLILAAFSVLWIIFCTNHSWLISVDDPGDQGSGVSVDHFLD